MEGVFFGADEIASDLLHFSYPYREYYATEFLKQGKILTWNPYLNSGIPVLAEAQTGAFYPLTLILYYFLPPPVAFNWLIISSFILVAIGTYLYARKIGLLPMAAFFSASVFSLSGFMIGHLRHVPVITAMAFMPWMFLVVEKMLEDYRAFWATILSLVVAFSFFAGHLTTTYLIVLILTIYFFLRLWIVFKEKGKETPKPIIFFLAGIAGGILLSAVQLLPSIELIKYSTRSLPDVLVFLGAGFKLRYLPLFFFPYLLGDPSKGNWNMGEENFWENIGYLGLLPLFLAVIGMVVGFKKKERLSISLSLLTFISLLLVLGKNAPLYELFWNWVPGFSFTRIPGRFLLFVDFFLAILAGFGLSFLLQKVKAQLKKYVFIGLFVLSLADLFHFGYFFNNVMPLTYFSEPPQVQFLKKDKELFRIRSVDSGRTSWIKAWEKSSGWRGDLSPYLAQRGILPPDYNLLYRIPSTSLIYTLVGHYSIKRPGELDVLVLNESRGENFGRLLGMENIKYLLSPEEIEEKPGIKLATVIQDEKQPDFKTYIYENEEFLPRAYLVGQASYFENPQDLLQKMLFGDFKPAKEVLVEEKIEVPQTSGEGEVIMENYQPTKVDISVDSKEGGFLVLSDTFYPGWKAYVDGQETKIMQANYAYRAVWIEKGEHSVVFNYDPSSVKIGKMISMASLFGLLVIFIFLFINKIRSGKVL